MELELLLVPTLVSHTVLQLQQLKQHYSVASLYLAAAINLHVCKLMYDFVLE